MPVVEAFHNGKPSPVDGLRIELCKPRTQIVGDPVNDPHPNFVPVLYRVLPAVLVLKSHAENTSNRLSTQVGSILFRVLSVRPGWHPTVAPLAVGEEAGSDLANCLRVEFA